MNLRKTLIILQFGFIQWLFPLLQNYAPWIANWWAPRLFITPPRLPYTEGEKEWLAKADHILLDYRGKKIRVYVWGEGPPVLMVHGWAGRGTNFYHFIPKLNEAGYRVIAFDAPAHGKSPGKRSDLIEFMEITKLLSEKYGPWKACLGHSLGGIAAYLMAVEGMKTDCLITLGTPSRKDDIFRTFFCRRLKGNTSSVRYLERWIENKIGFNFDKVFPIHQHPLKNPKRLLIVHDVGDRDAMVEEAELLHSGNPGSEVLITKGLGHNRILRDQSVIGRCVEFINAHS